MNWQTLSRLTPIRLVSYPRDSSGAYHGLIPLKVGQVWQHCTSTKYHLKIEEIISPNKVLVDMISPDDNWNNTGRECSANVFNMYNLVVDNSLSIKLSVLRK